MERFWCAALGTHVNRVLHETITILWPLTCLAIHISGRMEVRQLAVRAGCTYLRSISANTKMIHYSCDRCKRLIETEDELRYVVRLEVQAKFGEDRSVCTDDSDHLLEIDEILERQDDDLDPMIDEEVYSRKRFDLCSECHAAFIRNPFGREATKSVGFSDN